MTDPCSGMPAGLQRCMNSDHGCPTKCRCITVRNQKCHFANVLLLRPSFSIDQLTSHFRNMPLYLLDFSIPPLSSPFLHFLTLFAPSLLFPISPFLATHISYQQEELYKYYMSKRLLEKGTKDILLLTSEGSLHTCLGLSLTRGSQMGTYCSIVGPSWSWKISSTQTSLMVSSLGCGISELKSAYCHRNTEVCSPVPQ